MRCSALPLATKCRGSYRLTQGHGSEQSRLGTAFHEAARAKVMSLFIDKASLQTRYGLTEDELKSIDYGIYNITLKIPKGALVLADDKRLTGINGKLRGTPDLGIYHNEIVTVVDWKSGWADVEAPETNNQLMGYGILIVETLNEQLPDHPIPKRIDLMVVQPKINQVKAFSFTWAQLLEREKDIEKIIDEADTDGAEFTTGPWCQSCFKCMNCPAFAEQIKTLARYVEPAVPGDPEDVERALRVLLPFAKAVGTVSKKVEAVAKAWVDRNGPLELGAGQTYAKVIGEKQEVSTRKTFEILKEFFDEENIWEVISASMTKINKLAVATKRGLSTIVKNRMIEAGALTPKTTVEYRIIKGEDHGPETRKRQGRIGTDRKEGAETGNR